MKIEIPYEVGTDTIVNGKRVYIVGLDVYINKKGNVSLIRAMTPDGTYVTLEKSTGNMDEKLKPCPFCNGAAEITKSFLYGKVTGYTASCKKCGCELKMYASKQGAINAWNRR